MAEYVLREDEDQQKVVQELLANAANPADVIWRPRSGVPHGGVYEIPDELAGQLIEHRRALAQAETARIERAEAAAAERDSADGVAEGLVTPAEAGFAANAAGDPGGPVEASGRDFDAHTLSDEEWAAKYPGEERPDLGTGELPEETDEAKDAAADDEADKPASRKRARRASSAVKADDAQEESK